MAHKCKIFEAFQFIISWPLIFCVDIHVCTISKVIDIYKEKEICLPNKEYMLSLM